MRPRIRLMFLGNRRIAWESLKLLLSDSYGMSFDVRAIVTDGSIWKAWRTLCPQSEACFISSERRQSAQIREAIEVRNIDVLLSVQYNWAIPGDVLNLVARRAFNLHNARLPDYKGYNSISHAIANRDTSYESTIHWMVEEVDSGDLAYVERTPIHADDTALSLYVRTVDAAVCALKFLLDDLASGVAPPRTTQPKGRGEFYPMNSVDSLADVTSKVDSEAVARIARAAFFPPYNAAYFLHEGQKYFVLPETAAVNSMVLGHPVNQPVF